LSVVCPARDFANWSFTLRAEAMGRFKQGAEKDVLVLSLGK